MKGMVRMRAGLSEALGFLGVAFILIFVMALMG